MVPEQQKYDGACDMSNAVCSVAKLSLHQARSTFQDALHPTHTHLMCMYLCVRALCVYIPV